MKISSRDSKIKRATGVAPLVFTLATLPWATACAPIVASAPFAARNDTVEPGDLAGPFDGQVVDAVSGKPLGQAIVQASWGFETGRGLTAPAGAAAVTMTTGIDGNYNIERLRQAPYGSRVVSMTLIVYKRGFIAYRSDRVFDDLRPRADFVQHRNLVKLERMASGISHVKHVRFVGGAGELKRALGSEVVEASLELLGGAPSERALPSEAPAPLLDAGVLLSDAELKAVTGYGGAFALEKLGDLPPSPSYGSRHFKAVDKPETFDAALRVWKLSPTKAEARYEQLMKDVPHAETHDEIADRSLRGYEGRIVAVAALDRSRGVVVELTCGLDQCRDADQAAALLKRIIARADRLGAPTSESADETVEEKAPSKEPSESHEGRFQLRPPELKR